ncbi:hypothetical protein Scep_029878 [Stephania cephalantha]|uniref:Uncharacterized protein n=1 Tax=Stephania cephalantha TaxID=152367 RepID=A0AAP0E249_9MAGN
MFRSRMFGIPVTAGTSFIDFAISDIGASINVISLKLYESLKIGSLPNTPINLTLANNTFIKPYGLLEDVLVKVNDLVFSSNFYVMEMGDSVSSTSPPILLERQFLKTTKTKLDIFEGTMPTEFENKIVIFHFKDEDAHDNFDESNNEQTNDNEFLELNHHNLKAEVYVINALTMKDENVMTKNERAEDTSNEKIISQEWRLKQLNNVENDLKVEEFKGMKNK